MASTRERYDRTTRGTGKVITSSLKKTDVVTSDGSIRVALSETDGLGDVANPLSVDGDSVYNKDVDRDLLGTETHSSIGTFEGNIEDIFGDYHNSIKDESAENPKYFIIRFHRPISANLFGIGSADENSDFSNVKITLYDLAGMPRGVIDDSANDSKFTSNLYYFIDPVTGVITTATFIEMKVEFHTADPVELSGMLIPKVLTVNALIQGIDDQTGLPTYAKFDNGEFIIGGQVRLKDSDNNTINPATYDAQISDDLEGLGFITINVLGTELVFTGETKHVSIRAHPDNNDVVFIGLSDVSDTGGNAIAFLSPGDFVKLDYDDVDNALFTISQTAGQKIMVGALL